MRFSEQRWLAARAWDCYLVQSGGAIGAKKMYRYGFVLWPVKKVSGACGSSRKPAKAAHANRVSHR